MSASYLDLPLYKNNKGKLNIKLYNKRDDYKFPIVNFPLIGSNIPVPAYDICILQLIGFQFI